MTSVDDFVQNFLQHEYDPVKAREYYLRTRKLKGRDSIKTQAVLKKAPKKIHEDEVPMKSPTGAKLVDFDGKGSGKATYSDGSVFDGNGWAKPASPAAGAASAAAAKRLNDSQRKASDARTRTPRRRIGDAEQKLIRAKTLANKVKDPVAKRRLLRQIALTERKLKATAAKQNAGRGQAS